MILETYKVLGRESAPQNGRDAKSLAEKLALSQPARFMRDFKDVFRAIKNETAKGDILLFMGAGDIKNLSDKLMKC